MVKGLSSSDIVAALEADGWVWKRTKGSHRQYTHPTKPGVVTVQHPRRDVPIGTVKSIEKSSGLKLR
jgi:predicted RNA binding protein YcfA (HicA-like mRNA interferase family)